MYSELFEKLKYATSIEEEPTTDSENDFNYYVDGSRIYFEVEEDNTIQINFVEADEDVGQGKGEGTKVMTCFIKDMVHLGFVNFELFADYDEDNFETPDNSVNGLKRLVKFYQSFGFETVCAYDCELVSQVDMNLRIKGKSDE